MSRHALFAVVLSSVGCATSGNAWVSEPLTENDPRPEMPYAPRSTSTSTSTSNPGEGRGLPSPSTPTPTSTSTSTSTSNPGEGRGLPSPSTSTSIVDPTRVVGVFRNTYYDFPRESDYSGPTLSLMSGTCSAIATVPRAFYEAVCVQGSGTLSRGKTVSFARRDCDCAEVCPRTGHRICFEALDAARFPWGRGAAGRAITPLVTVAADTRVLPLGTPIYVPEFDGVARDDSSVHDGCFVVEDRGVRVLGNHIDVFTGNEAATARMNRVVPSNKGVTVVRDEPRCERLRR